MKVHCSIRSSTTAPSTIVAHSPICSLVAIGLYDDFQRRAEEIQDGILPTADSSSDSDSEEGGAAAAAARRLAEAQAAAAKAKAEAEAKVRVQTAHPIPFLSRYWLFMKSLTYALAFGNRSRPDTGKS